MVLIQEVNEEPADQTIQILEKQLAEARQRVQELERRLSEARNAKPKAKCEPAAGFRRMEIVEASDDEDDEPTPASTPAEPFSDLRVEYTLQGVEQAKQKANTLFAEGKTSDAERWFSKALWVAEESGKVKEVPETLRSQLHSNRAFARLKLQQWPGAEDDCTKALTINSGNFKALYRRAQARFELKNRKGALDDVEKLLPELAKAKASDKEALELREKILALPSGQKEPPKQEAEAKRNSPKAEMPKPKSPSAPAPGFRRMEIVEASDDEEDEPVPATGTAEPFPDLKVEFTVTSLEEAKQKANTLFAEGKTSDAERWFSKAIWVAEESGKMKEVPENLRSVLHSNRAFARLKLKQWPGVEDDCTKALSLNTGNAKALYRRAQARFELKQRQGALDDVEKLLPLLAPPSDKEAQELREKILALPAEGEPPKKATAEPPKTSSPKAAAPMPNGSSEPEPAPGFRRMEIVEASDDEDDEPAPVSNGSDSPKAKAPAEPYPDLHIEFTAAGLEKAKQQANGLFSAGNTSESERWFSKALWVAQESGQVKEVPDSLRAVLYSNRAFARLKMKNWPGVEEDCTKALALSSNNAKALYRRAQARFELKQRKGALEDVEKLLPLLASPSDKDALELRDKILALPSEEGEPKKAEAPKPSSPKAEAPKPSSPKAEAPKPSSPKADPPKSSSPKAAAPKPSSPSAPPAAGFRRMEIVEASDDEDEELAPAKTATGPAEPHADLRVEFTVQGVEKAKQQANTLFSEGKTSDAERWFSKAIWVAEESGKVKEVPDSLRSVLHTNRAFARLKLKQWPGVEDDCTKALSLSASNAKALYRRAQARFELKQRQEALEDVEKLLPLLGPPSDKEALELREKILALPTQTTEPAKKAAPASPKEASEPPPGFKRMQIVEASDSEEEAEPAKMSNGHGGEPLSPSKPATTSPAARDPPPGFRRLQIQEASDDEEPAPPKMSNGVSTPNGFAPPSPAKAEAKAAAERKAAETEVKKMPPEPYPEIKLEHTVAGAEKAKEEGNRLFAAGSIEESARWFSKAIWLVEESGYVTGVTATLHAILHSNRAFARLKMRQWTDAEVDCSQALTFNSSNPKALYRRAMARKELQKYDAALADVEALLPMLDQAPSKDALDLREELLRLTAPSKEVPKAEKAAPKEPAQKPPSPAGAASRAPAPAALASLPAASPKSSMEMLRQLKSLKRNPTVMTQYVSERVPPALLQSLFSKSPIEADDLALVLQCLRTAAAADTPMPPATVGEYLQQLLRTNAAETQFSMLSTSEKQIVRELITLAPSGDQVELEKRFKRVLS